MATLDDVASLATALPEVVEGERHDARAWSVNGKTFSWERGFSKADLKRYGDQGPPAGPILALSVADLSEKEAVLAAGKPGFFTIPHFNGYSAVLVQLTQVRTDALREAVVDAWLVFAPREVADEYLGSS